MTHKYPKLLLFEKKLELPMLVLSFLWLFILITELVYGLNPLLYLAGNSIWSLFIFYFSLRLVLAPNRLSLLKKNWLFVLAILVSILRFFPFVQTFPVVRIATATFGMQVIWIFASADQGLRSLRRTFGRRGAGYVLALTIVVIFAGAAGIYNFERTSTDPQSIQSFPMALWWTAMQMTNIGSSYSLRTAEGRVICFAVSLYAIAMFSYLTALFATVFIGHEASDPKSEIASQSAIIELKEEIAQLRVLVEEVLNSIPKKRN